MYPAAQGELAHHRAGFNWQALSLVSSCKEIPALNSKGITKYKTRAPCQSHLAKRAHQQLQKKNHVTCERKETQDIAPIPATSTTGEVISDQRRISSMLFAMVGSLPKEERIRQLLSGPEEKGLDIHTSRISRTIYRLVWPHKYVISTTESSAMAAQLPFFHSVTHFHIPVPVATVLLLFQRKKKTRNRLHESSARRKQRHSCENIHTTHTSNSLILTTLRWSSLCASHSPW